MDDEGRKAKLQTIVKQIRVTGDKVDMEIFVDVDNLSHKDKHAEHFVEKTKVFHLLSKKVNLKLLADPTYPIKPKTFGQKLRKKRMDLGIQIKELAHFLGVVQNTIINWELKNVKPSRQNFRKAKEFLGD